MRLIQFIIILAGILFNSCDNDDYPHAEIPSIVLNEFWANFPTATDVKFIKLEGDYEVDFEMSGKDAGAVIAQSGTLLKEKKEISFKQLPTEIRDAFMEYGKDKIEDLEMVKTSKNVSYQAQVKQFWFDKKLVLDNTGKLDSSTSYWD